MTRHELFSAITEKKLLKRVFETEKSGEDGETLHTRRRFPMSCDRWIESSSQGTQILYRADISMVLYYTEIRKGQVVVESGTGMLGLTYCLSKIVGECGLVHTVEQNEERFERAKKEIEKAELKNTTVHKGAVKEFLKEFSNRTGLQSADRVVLDVPKPHEVLNESAEIVSEGGKVMCFVPCMEQAQRVLHAAEGHPALQIEQMLENVEIQHKPTRISEGVFGTVQKPLIRGHTGYLIFLKKKVSYQYPEKQGHDGEVGNAEMGCDGDNAGMGEIGDNGDLDDNGNVDNNDGVVNNDGLLL